METTAEHSTATATAHHAATEEVAVEVAAKAPTPSKGPAYVPIMDDRYLDYPISGLNPTKLAASQREADLGTVSTFMELLEEIEDRDAQIAQCMATRKNGVVRCDYDIEPFRDYRRRERKEPALDKDRRVADFVRDVLFGLPVFEARLRDLLDAIYKGFSCAEIIYKRGGQRSWTIEDIVWVPQRKFTFYEPNDASGKPRLLTEREPSYGVSLRENQWIVHCPRTRSVEPWRDGVGRLLSWYYVMKHLKIRDWMIFLETHAHPLRLGVYTPGMSELDKRKIELALARMSTDQAAVVAAKENGESPIEVKYPSTQSASSSFLDVANYMDKEIAKAILGQTLTSDADGKGSYALGQVHNDVRLVILAADADALSVTIRDQLIRPLVWMNFGAEYLSRLPSFRIYYEPPEDIERLARAYGVATQQAGLRISQKMMHEKLGTEAPDGDEDGPIEPEPVTPPAPPATPPEEPPADEEPPETDDEAMARVALADDERPTDAPEIVVVGALGMKLPKPVASAAVEYAAVVDGFNEMAFRNTMDNVTKYLARRDKPWASGEAFASEFTSWWEKKWWTFYGTEGISKGTLYPFLERMYGYYKTVDKTAKAPGLFTITEFDGSAIDFMTRADRWYFSSFIDNQSFRGPLQQFLLAEYEERGGMLWGQTNEKVIEGFRKAVTKTSHELSRYEVDRIIKSTVNRNRVWAHLSQMDDAGIRYAEIVNGPSPCEYCAAVGGARFEIAPQMSWVREALAMSDEDFRVALNERTATHRADVKAGDLTADEIASHTRPPYHPHCQCRLVAVL